MIHSVSLIVNRVNPSESSRLAEEIDLLLPFGGYHMTANRQVNDDFVITIHDATIPDIKNTLCAVLKIVKPDRIAITT